MDCIYGKFQVMLDPGGSTMDREQRVNGTRRPFDYLVGFISPAKNPSLITGGCYVRRGYFRSERRRVSSCS